MARVSTVPLRRWLTGIGLFGLLASIQLLPTTLGPAVDNSTPTSIVNTSEPTAELSPTSTASLTATSARTIAPTFDPLDSRIGINTILGSLQLTGAVPAGGRLLFSVPDGYAITTSAGENFLPVGSGQNAQDFVLAVQMGWYSAGAGSACGISFRAGPSDWRSLLVTSDGRLLVARQTGSTRTIYADLPITSFSSRPYKNALWLTVNGSNLRVYLNGEVQITAADEPTRGGFALDVYNAVGNAVITDCRYRNLWVWSFDNGTQTIIPSLTATSSS